MAGLCPQGLEYTISPSEPIVEDIKESCDSCVELIRCIVHAYKHEDSWIPKYSLGSSPETCRLCEIKKGRSSARKLQQKFASKPMKSIVLYVGELDRLCGAEIDGFEFSMWADEGS